MFYLYVDESRHFHEETLLKFVTELHEKSSPLRNATPLSCIVLDQTYLLSQCS